MSVVIKFIKLNEDVVSPTYANEGDAGADISSTEDVVIYPQERLLVSTGLSMDIPNGYVGLIHPRSGMAFKYGITVLNAPGTIDAGYRGEIKVLLFNSDKFNPKYIKKGDRIAQLVIQKVEKANFAMYPFLDETDRGNNGFGSTGA
jgi:dUTP pyrophosphatase